MEGRSVRIWCIKENSTSIIFTVIQSAIGTTDIVSLNFNPGLRKQHATSEVKCHGFLSQPAVCKTNDEGNDVTNVTQSDKKSRLQEAAFCGIYWIRTSDPRPVKAML